MTFRRKLTDKQRETLVFLNRHSGRIQVKRIAYELGMSQKSTRIRINNLHERGLVRWVKYWGAEITENGRKAIGQ